MDRIEITVEATVNPTEDLGRVEKAIGAIVRARSVEKIELGKESYLLRAQAQGLDALAPFQAILRQDRIRDAARKILFSSILEKKIQFYLNKQVAYVSHASFSKSETESPLGSIKVEISCGSPESVIDWITPRSR